MEHPAQGMWIDPVDAAGSSDWFYDKTDQIEVTLI